MKTYLFKPKDLIRRGILRIFPIHQKVIVIVLVIVSALLISCGSQKQVAQLVRDIRVDTIYLTNAQYDSIYIYKDRVSEHHLGTLEPSGTLKPDTLFIKDVSVEFRYRKLTDTLRIVQRDSIPYEVTVTEVKDIQRPLTLFDKLCRLCFWFLTTCLTLFIAHKINR